MTCGSIWEAGNSISRKLAGKGFIEALITIGDIMRYGSTDEKKLIETVLCTL